MEAIILAAGYATRLYPLTQSTPKPLLLVKGKPIVEHILGKIEPLAKVHAVTIITNSKFYPHFKKWSSSFAFSKPIEIIDNGTQSNETRRGAVGDLHFAIRTRNINDDLLVIAGDNLFELSLEELSHQFKKKEHNTIVLFDVSDKELAKHYGVVEVENDTVKHFEEKPTSPRSTLISTGIYFFKKHTLELIEKYLAQKNSPDKTGEFIEWLHKREAVHAFITKKTWYDIGTHEQLADANRHYRE